MCDDSLNFVASRPAKVGDKLVSTQFSGSTVLSLINVLPQLERKAAGEGSWQESQARAHRGGLQ
jgi:hypothetical protein